MNVKADGAVSILPLRERFSAKLTPLALLPAWQLLLYQGGRWDGFWEGDLKDEGEMDSLPLSPPPQLPIQVCA